jgi:hypothetical protein
MAGEGVLIDNRTESDCSRVGPLVGSALAHAAVHPADLGLTAG